MSQKKLDKVVYKEAKSFLLENTPDSVTKEVIDSYLSLPPPIHSSISINDIYRRLLFSAQNSNQKKGVIGGSIGGIENLSPVLSKFDPHKVSKKYSGKTKELLDEIVKKLKPNGKIRKGPKSLWPMYCHTIVSSAEFIAQFPSSKEFFEWSDFFYNDSRSLAALPMTIEAEVYGIGFPLACDFLKELGYVKYGKPDVQIRDIFLATGLSESSKNYQLLKAIFRISGNVNRSAYDVDKVFWLIGSGDFYNHPEIGRKGKVRRMKKDFINHISKM